MARKVPTEKKFVAPKKGEKKDVRCAFVTKYDERTHSKLTVGDWCFGCGFYVCSNCEKTDPDAFLGPDHDVGEHQPDDFDDDVDVN